MGNAEDLNVNRMVCNALVLVERFTDNSWLEWGAELMPRFVARIEHAREMEEQRRAEEVQ